MSEEVATFSLGKSNQSKKSCGNQGLQTLACPKRTQGDGMENANSDETLDENNKPIKVRLGEALIYHPTNLKQQTSTPPVTPTGQIVNLTPTSSTQLKKDRHTVHAFKSKEPKFVPYEPYKAAVNPIIPYEKNNKKRIISKNNLDINVMVAQLAHLKTEEINKDINRDEKVQFSDTVNLELQKLKEENSQLENQLKFQAQVNGELKNLLVAAMGEDLQTRVHLLTEDKLQLSQALLNSAKHLNTHQEQTEWLAGQCEVWRSKFLASSLMVEELAKWKAALSQRTTDLQESIKRLLEERCKVRETNLKTYRTLSILRENFDIIGKRHELPSTNIIDLTDGCCQLSELLQIQLLSGMDKKMRKEINITGLEMKTTAEKNAEQLLKTPNLLMSGCQDAACSAVMGAAVAVSGRMFLPTTSSSSDSCYIPACCPHCSGEIKQV